jgi:hypothetical protein
MDYIYYCSNNEDNDCQKKNECKRFVNAKDQCLHYINLLAQKIISIFYL